MICAPPASRLVKRSATADCAGFCPSTDWDTVDFSSAPAIQELPITSVVCSPAEGEAVTPRGGTVAVKGYAWSGGGRRVVRVDVSADGGKSWMPAELHSEDTTLHRAWAWTLWKVRGWTEAQLGKDAQSRVYDHELVLMALAR